jgi:simple sugar transport system substrate-binding protein
MSLKAILGTGALIATIATTSLAQQITVVTHGRLGDAFWDVVRTGVMDGAAETGLDVTYLSPDTYDMVAMAALIDGALQGPIDGLVVSLPDTEALGPSISRAIAQGVPVISINSGSDEAFLLGVKLHVGQNEFAAGQAAGARLAELGGTRAICVNHEVGNIALDLRCAGFAQSFTGQVEMLKTDLEKDTTVAVVRGALQQNPEIDTIITLGADNAAIPALAALEAEGRGDDVMIGTFDLSGDVLRAVADGKVTFAIDQQQYEQGYIPILLFKEYLTTGNIPAHDIQTGPNLVSIDTVDAFLE